MFLKLSFKKNYFSVQSVRRLGGSIETIFPTPNLNITYETKLLFPHSMIPFNNMCLFNGHPYYYSLFSIALF